jgi:sialic acid synthase SpsE
MMDRREIYEKAELSKQDHIELIEYCNQIGIKFLSSVFSIPDAKLLKKLGCTEVKIPSFESRNYELIKYCGKHFKTVFMSTGTSTLDEIKESKRHFGTAIWYLMHCVSTYPCDYSIANLPKMISLKKMHDRVGYSDHIQGIDSAKIAIGFGAQVIEKHFTIDNNLPGRDNKFAILPHELLGLTQYISYINDMMIDHGTGYNKLEADSRKIMQVDLMDNISIIIRNRNESEFIGFALQSCLDYFNNPEIIIVDNNSTDDSLEIVNLFIDRANIKIVKINDYTPGKSINLGVQQCLEYYISFVSTFSNY